MIAYIKLIIDLCIISKAGIKIDSFEVLKQNFW